MGSITSRQNAAVEEADISANHAYKYPPRAGTPNRHTVTLFCFHQNYLLKLYRACVCPVHYFLLTASRFCRHLLWQSFHNGRWTIRYPTTRIIFVWWKWRLEFSRKSSDSSEFTFNCNWFDRFEGSCLYLLLVSLSSAASQRTNKNTKKFGQHS